jgi:hypothetical protein
MIPRDIAIGDSKAWQEIMGQRNFKTTNNTKRSENGVLGTFGEGSIKSGGRIGVTDSWGVESTLEPRNFMEEPSNCHGREIEYLLGCFFE